MKFDGQLGTSWKQSKTKDQTGTGTKIKGSDYDFSGGLITKLHKHPRTKSEISFKVAKRCRFTKNYSLSSAGNKNRGSVSSRDSVAAVEGRRVSRLMFLAAVMHAGRYQETPATSGYKSQRKNRTKGGGQKYRERKSVRKRRREKGENTVGNSGEWNTKEGRTMI